MITIENLQTRYFDMAGLLEAPPKYVKFHQAVQHDGSPHVEIHSDEMAYIHTEKGLQREKKITSDPDELLYWLMSDLTFQMAVDYESENRRPGEDARRKVFKKNLELLGRLNPGWAKRKEDEYSTVLAENPFQDEA